MNGPDIPYPGQHTTYVHGEDAIVVASAWMADPNPDGIYICFLMLLNEDPDYYATVWMETGADDMEWEAKDVRSFVNIIDATRHFEEITR